MPRRTDLESICVIGSGPIVIGQAAEFDYSGCQALKVLREDGYRTIVVNSNPATIMTDPGFADRTYIEPLDLEGVASVLNRERPDALLPTMGGQTALNLSVQLAEAGVDCLGRDGVAIAEDQVVAEREGQCAGIAGILPPLRRRRHQVAVVVAVEQGVVERSPDVALVAVVQLCGIERVGWGLHSQGDRGVADAFRRSRRVRVRALSARACRQSEDQRGGRGRYGQPCSLDRGHFELLYSVRAGAAAISGVGEFSRAGAFVKTSRGLRALSSGSPRWYLCRFSTIRSIER